MAATPVRAGQDRPGRAARLREGSGITPAALGAARQDAPHWRAALSELWERVDLLALPALLGFPPALDDAAGAAPDPRAHLAGEPGGPARAGAAGARRGPLPASVQLIGPPGGEERLLAAGAVLEQAVRG